MNNAGFALVIYFLMSPNLFSIAGSESRVAEPERSLLKNAIRLAQKRRLKMPAVSNRKFKFRQGNREDLNLSQKNVHSDSEVKKTYSTSSPKGSLKGRASGGLGFAGQKTGAAKKNTPSALKIEKNLSENIFEL